MTNSGDLAQLYGVTATVMIICLGVLYNSGIKNEYCKGTEIRRGIMERIIETEHVNRVFCSE